MAGKQNKVLKQELADLKAIAGQLRSVSGVLTATFTVLPIGGAFTEPLLPGVLGVIAPVLAVVLCALALLFTFFSCRDSDPAQLAKRASVAFASSLFLLAGFIFVWLTFVVNVGDVWLISGTVLTDEAASAVRTGSVSGDSISLLSRFGFQSENRIWAGRNIVTFILAASFAGFFALASMFFFLFTMRSLREESSRLSSK